MDRRTFLSTAALVTGMAPLGACAASQTRYDDAVRRTWRSFDDSANNSARALQRELVRYATLAPSSHNTQCWTFALAPNRISLFPDLARRCPAVDPDDHHLFVSLGCATENLVIAALANGFHGTVAFDQRQLAVHVDLEPARAASSPLFTAIPLRQCSRTDYDGTSLSPAELRTLEAAGSGSGVQVMLFTSRGDVERLLPYVTAGNSAQIGDPAFMAELLRWIRFNDGEALDKRDGLSTRASGNPELSRWYAGPLFKHFYTAGGENAKYEKSIRSSAGIAVFVSEANDRAHWIETGRCYERFALQSTVMGVRTAMLNQAVEVASVRPQLASALAIGRRRPDLVVRFGHGPVMPRSLRRPLEAIIRT